MRHPPLVRLQEIHALFLRRFLTPLKKKPEIARRL
jgi:hypothetical protein